MIPLLSNTSKMPGKSWELPAVLSCPGAVVAPGSICAKCYGKRGHYPCPNVKNALLRRWQWFKDCSDDEFHEAMVEALDNERWFRVNSNGDFPNVGAIYRWVRLATALPHVHFWVATRTWHLPWMLTALRKLADCPNVTVRPSSLFFNAPAPRVHGLHAGTTASTGGYNCPSSLQGGSCGMCRACWVSKSLPITYKKH